MARKLRCLCDCDHTVTGPDEDTVGRRMGEHLQEAHGMPADPLELAELALPRYRT